MIEQQLQLDLNYGAQVDNILSRYKTIPSTKKYYCDEPDELAEHKVEGEIYRAPSLMAIPFPSKRITRKKRHNVVLFTNSWGTSKFRLWVERSTGEPIAAHLMNADLGFPYRMEEELLITSRKLMWLLEHGAQKTFTQGYGMWWVF